MKKYIKPMMESEAFVANEFVSACWTIECTNNTNSCGEITGKNDYPSGLTLDGTKGVYSGNIGNIDPGCRTQDTVSYKDYDMSIIGFLTWLFDVIFGSTTETVTTHFHPVEVKEGWKNHPNASV